jgi:hypothetical protein
MMSTENLGRRNSTVQNGRKDGEQVGRTAAVTSCQLSHRCIVYTIDGCMN